MTAKTTSKSQVAEKSELPPKVQEPKITGILVRDPLSGPDARKSRSGLIWSRPTPKGEALYFHENPEASYLPHEVGSKAFRRMLDGIKLEEYGATPAPATEE
ncbi:MAG: hypothetical protein AB7V18_19105 [Pyrinomonadaceae bacterium]